MSNNNKRRKKTTKKKTSPSWSSLPDDVALSFIARISKSDYASLSLVSKRFRSLIASHELCLSRSMIGRTEASFFVCLRIFSDLTPCWFVLTRKHWLRLIQTSPDDQASEGSSFVVVDWGIYVIGGRINGKSTSDVWLLDCYSKIWRKVPSMKMARASASASLVDEKIYVFGGCEEEVDSLVEVFDIKTQTWSNLVTKMMPRNVQQSVVVEGKKIYAVDEDDQSFCFSPSEDMFWRMGKKDSKRGYRNDWCAIGNVLYCRGTRGRILWCEPGEFDWKEVLVFSSSGYHLCGSRLIYGVELFSTPIHVHYGISSLSVNSSGNLVALWTMQLENPDVLQLCYTEISLEKRKGDEIRGTVVWSGPVSRLDPFSESYGVKVLYSASVYL